jgi:hypothetical protein
MDVFAVEAGEPGAEASVVELTPEMTNSHVAAWRGLRYRWAILK